MVSRTDGKIDVSLIGENTSPKGHESKGSKRTVITSVELVMSHHLQETSFTEEAYKNMNPEGMVALLDYQEDGAIQ
ncbi:Translationally-controlled tumor protein, partial [Galemys pyrenaicus]